MLMITLIALLLAIPLTSYSTKNAPTVANNSVTTAGSSISATLFTRITAIALLYAAALSYSSSSVLMYSDSGSSITGQPDLDAGLGLYSGLIHATTITQTMEVFLLVSAALILLP